MDAIPSYKIAASLALTMIALQAINMFSGYALNTLGILPRSLTGLSGLLLSPWLHTSWSHLSSNLPPFALLSIIVLRDGLSRYLAVSASVILLGGLMVWTLGRDLLHVGASGWVFGLWGFILASAWFHRSFSNLAAALFAVVFYSGMAFGFLPWRGISFESHLGGALAGIVAARLFATPRTTA